MSRKRIRSSRAPHIDLASNTGRWEGRGAHLMTGNYYSQEGTESTDPSGCGCFKENSSTSFVRYVHIRRHVCRLRWSQLEMSSSGGIHRHCCKKKRKCDTNTRIIGLGACCKRNRHDKKRKKQMNQWEKDQHFIKCHSWHMFIISFYLFKFWL